MKRLKFCLALVLALVVVLSFALTAHAANELTFTDANKITQKMPATILYGLGVINGYPNNTFRPDTTITRAEFCKMLATLDNGGKALETDYTAALTFSDTSESPLKNDIAYCVTMGYAAGKNAQTFDPEGKITMLEAAKMLLVALGHDPMVEGFVGENWNENVRTESFRARSALFSNYHKLTESFIDRLTGQTVPKAIKDPVTEKTIAKAKAKLTRAQATQIYDAGIREVTVTVKKKSVTLKDEPVDTMKILNAELTRDDACLMFYNALLANVVLNSGNAATIDGITVSAGTGLAEAENTDFDYMNRGFDTKLQLVEKLFPNLRVKQDASDEYGRPCGYWVNGPKEIGPFVFLTPLFNGEGPITARSVRNQIAEDPASVEFYLDGKLVDTADMLTVENLLGLPDVDCAHYLREHDTSFCGKLNPSYSASMLALIWRNSTYQLGKYTTSGTVTGTANRVCYYGTHNEVYYNTTTKRVTVTSEGLFPARVNKVFPAQVDENGEEIAPAYVSSTILTGSSYVKPLADLELSDTVTAKITNDKNALFPVSADNETEAGEFTPGEIVLLSFGYKMFEDETTGVKTGKYIVRKAYRTTPVTGKISGPIAYSSAKASTVSHFRMNGESKPNYLPIRKNGVFPLSKFAIGDNYTIYIGNVSNYSGKAISTWVFYAEAAAQEESDRIFYVIKAGAETDILGEKTYRARVVNSSGEIQEIITDQNYSYLVDCLASFSIDANDKYQLLKVGSSGLGSFSVKQGNAMMTLTPAKSTAISIRGDQDLDFTNERQIVADDSTLFIIGSRVNDTEEMTYTTYKGIKNVPDAESTPYYNYAVKDGVATTVFIYENKSGTSSTSYGLLFKTDKDLFNTYTIGSTGYYEMQAVINDEPQTVKVTPKLYESLKYGINLFSGLSTTTEGWLSAVSLLNSKYVYPITALEPTDKGVLHVNFDANGNGGEYLVVHDDVHVYAYSLRDRAMNVITTDLLSELGDMTGYADTLFGGNQPMSYYTLHETVEGKPLAGIFIIVN